MVRSWKDNVRNKENQAMAAERSDLDDCKRTVTKNGVGEKRVSEATGPKE